MKTLTTILILFLSINILISQKPKFKKVTKEELQKKVCDIDSLAKAEYLYKGCKVKFEFNENKDRFEVVYKFHERIKIYDDSYTDIANYSIRYFKGENNAGREKISNLKAYTFNLENGKVVNEKVSKKNIYEEEQSKYYELKKFAFPAIKDGSILELEYELRSQYYFNIDEFYFQTKIPISYVEYLIETPEYFNYNANAKGLIPLNKESKNGSGSINYSYVVDIGTDLNPKRKRYYETITFQKTISKYTVSDVPAIIKEPYVYTMDNYRSSIRHELLFTNFPNSPIKYYTKDWNDIATMLNKSDAFGKELTRKVKQYNDLLDSVKDMDDPGKIGTIYSTVQRDFTWDGYLGSSTSSGIKKLLDKGTGNIAEINLLLVNLLQRAGINAKPRVSRSSSSGFLNTINPSISQLNYVIAVVEIDGKYLYLDASDSNLTFNTLPKRALNLKGITIDGETGVESKIVNPNRGKINNIYTLNIDDESMKGSYSHTVDGYYAYVTRANHKSGETYMKEMDTEKKKYSNISVENYSDRSKKIKIKSDVTTEGCIQYVEDKIFVDINIADDKFENPFKADVRQFALFFESAFSNIDMLKIKIPEGYEVENPRLL